MTPDYRQLTQTSTPAEPAVSLADAKAHLRVTFTQTDDLIADLVEAATEWAEGEINRALVSRSYDLVFDSFYPLNVPSPATFPGLQSWAAQFTPERPFLPIWGEIRLPKPPLVSVDKIQYLDLNGISQVLDPSQYQVITGGRLPGTLCPAYGLSWPYSRVQIGGVVISYTAGYGAATALPSSIRRAILLMVGQLYRNREATTDVAQVEVPLAVRALLSKHRWRAIA